MTRHLHGPPNMILPELFCSKDLEGRASWNQDYSKKKEVSPLQPKVVTFNVIIIIDDNPEKVPSVRHCTASFTCAILFKIYDRVR